MEHARKVDKQSRQLLAPYVARALQWLLLLGAAAAITVQGIYIYKFVGQPGDWWTLSASRADWGTYGDFVGGMLNPIFSFLAFIGVVLTVVLQARQLDEVKALSSREEMQRVASTVAARVDELLSRNVIGDVGFLKLGSAQVSMFNLIAAGGTKRLQELAGTLPEGWLAYAGLPDGEKYAEAVDGQSTVLRIELESLSWMLLKYQLHNGNHTVLDFYRHRYQAVACWLDALCLLDHYPQTQAFFKPNEVRPHLLPKTPVRSSSSANPEELAPKTE